MILPGATLGMLGGGQLGRMFTIAARTMGYRVVVLDPDPQSPAGSIADLHLKADYHDENALDVLSRQCEAITTEFENVPADVLEFLAASCYVRPGADAVRITQDRIHEKNFLVRHGLPTNRFAVIHNVSDISNGAALTGLPSILKRSRLGYDGKGQLHVDSVPEAIDAFHAMGDVPCVLEEKLDFQCEISVVLARSITGQCLTYPAGENIHVNGILDTTIVPARVSKTHAEHAKDIAVAVAEKLDYHGVLAVEMFGMPDGRILINEIAPRPHNSGHYTLDACVTDQFEQQVRILTGFEPGSTDLLSPVVMKNILGDQWGDSHPRWEKLLHYPNAKLHLYGKTAARPGRKMGHVNILDRDVERALRVGDMILNDLLPLK
jgi:5-(carboxyamino)imidazole ribonucleotide synthase